VTSVTFAPGGTTLASGAGDMTARLWMLSSGQTSTTLKLHGDQVTAVAYSPDGKLLASASLDATVRLWDPSTGTAIKTLTGHGDGVKSVAFSPDGARLASGSWDRTVRLWESASGQSISTLSTGEGVTEVAFARGSTVGLLAVAGWEGTTSIWSLGDAKRRIGLRTIASRDAGYAFTTDGKIELFGDAREYPICRIGPLSFPLDLCEEHVVVPGLVRATMEADASQIEP
jgi:WD40 repeat protein